MTCVAAADVFSRNMGQFNFRYERYSEFSTYTFSRRFKAPLLNPFLEKPAIDYVSNGWVSTFPGADPPYTSNLINLINDLILSDIFYQPYTINPTLSTLHYQPYTINRLLSTLYYQPYTINPILSTV
jgi:hypothetical protein